MNSPKFGSPASKRGGSPSRWGQRARVIYSRHSAISYAIAVAVGMSIQAIWGPLWSSGISTGECDTASSILSSSRPPRRFTNVGSDEIEGRSMSLDVYSADPAVLGNAAALEAALSEALSAHVAGHKTAAWSIPLATTGFLSVVATTNGYVTARTWPKKRFATVDLVVPPASNNEYYGQLLPAIAKALGTTVSSVRWSSTPRGVDKATDLDRDILARFHFDKEMVTSVNSDFQRIEIWGTNEENEYGVQKWEEAEDDDEEEAAEENGGGGGGKNADEGEEGVPTYTARLERTQQDRMLFLDDVVQSGEADEVIYHESLVHPAMVSHERPPERVAILGGGEGATLREVLKHKSVKEAVMIELDPGVISVCREHMPAFNKCDWDYEKQGSCFDDPRATIVTEDVVKWFNSQFHGDACKAPEESKFDVLIVDLLDPELLPDGEAFAKFLYSKAFLKQLSCSLKKDGVMITQLGETVMAGSVDMGTNWKVELVDAISANYLQGGFFLWDAFVPTFKGAWTFAMGCKTSKCANRFMDNTAAINLALRQRLIGEIGHGVVRADLTETSDKLLYYDGASHQLMQQIPKGWETAYCAWMAEWSDLKDPNSPLKLSATCDWTVRPTAEDGQTVPESFIGVEVSQIDKDDKTGTGRKAAIATRDIAENERLGLFDAATSFEISRTDFDRLVEFAETHDSLEYKNMVEWLNRYGYACDEYDGGRFYVSMGSLFSFVNHGCDADDVNLDGVVVSKDGRKSDDDAAGRTDDDGWDEYDPNANFWNVVERRRARESCVESRATRAIRKGAPFLENYKTFDWNDGKLAKDALAGKMCKDA